MTHDTMTHFKIVSDFKPTGDQPQACKLLVAGLNSGQKHQVLLGVTGSGKSLTYSEQILIFEKDQTKILAIGELIEKLFDQYSIDKIGDSEVLSSQNVKNKFSVLSINPQTGQQKIQLIVQFIRHNSPKQIFNVETTCGREVNVTGDHNFWVLRNGEFELIKTTEIKKNDYLPVPLQIPLNNTIKLDGIWLNKWFERNTYFKLSDLPSDLHNQNKLKPILSYQKYYHVLNNGERVNTNQLELIAPLQDNLRSLKIGRRIGKEVEVFQKLTDDFLRLIGLYIAEGHAEKNYLLISVHEEALQNKLVKDLRSLSINYTERAFNPGDFQISNSLLSELFSLWCGSNSYNKHLPPWFLQLAKSQLALIISAYFSGDGSVAKNEISAATASKKLASDLSYALLSFGIQARIRKKWKRATNSITKNKKLYYELIISGQKDKRIFEREIGFILERKQKALKLLTEKNSNTNVDIIPINGKRLRDIRLAMDLSQKRLMENLHCSRSYISMLENNKRSPSRELLKRIIEVFKGRSVSFEIRNELEKLESLTNIFWTKIKKVQPSSPPTKYVYDVAVEKNETFLAGMGGIFVHNTFTMANVIEKVQKPTLVISHNKTLAGQLAQEFRSLFPKNAVEYFVSYYDYYQPEAYVPQSDTYIEKETEINEEIEKLRLSTTTSLLTRKDVIVVASVSCIYNLGSPKEYGGAILELKEGVRVGFQSVLKMLHKMFYSRNDLDFKRSTYRVKGDTVDIFPAYSDSAVRVEFLGERIEKVSHLDPLTGSVTPTPETLVIYPAKHYITNEARAQTAMGQIEQDLKFRIKTLRKQGKLLEAQRLEQRTYYDLEMIKEFGYCNGIENYSRYFDGRKEGNPPYTLMEYFPKDCLIIIDESHITLPQLRGMYNGDRSRKETLVEFGFRLPSALDNRPLKFDEFQRRINQVIYVSATPDEYELSLAGYKPGLQAQIQTGFESGVAEQLIRPTGILDPQVSVRPTQGQIEDVIKEVEKRVTKHERVLITTLTKRMAEDLSDYLKEKGIKVNYLHSDIKTLERSDILNSLRLGEYDVIVGINLLREGLDLPEVTLVIILDADKEGFLRSQTSLIQTMGRAARHVNGQVIMYADTVTRSMKAAIDEVDRRRKYQQDYNKKHNIKPRSIEKALRERLIEKVEELQEQLGKKELTVDDIPHKERQKMIKNLESQMKQAAQLLDFEEAARLRDQIRELSS